VIVFKVHSPVLAKLKLGKSIVDNQQNVLFCDCKTHRNHIQ
jgi:hypothetical protein